MARAVASLAPDLTAAISRGIALVVKRRGYSAAAAGSSTPARRVAAKDEKPVIKWTKKKDGGEEVENSWVPDPVTGYYRPANRIGEVDAAELREAFLSRHVDPNIEQDH